MTILNIANDGLYNVLIVLHRAISSYGPMPEERLISLCQPASSSDSKKVGQTLLRWTQLGLFMKSDDGVISVRKEDKDPGQLPSICRRILLDKRNNENFWDSERSGAADFTRAVSFFLAQDIYSSDFSAHLNIENLEARFIRDKTQRILQNNTRWNGFLHWSSFLGFIWDDGRRWPDPTLAIREELAVVFGGHSELAASDFVGRLGKVLPVLDEGVYRREVESKLDASEWQTSGRSNQLSTSLSRALWRLSRPGGPLTLEARADAENTLTLQGSGNRNWQSFSHVLFVRRA